MNLKNKVIVITGGSRGLGKALAIGLIREGAKVVISSEDRKELARTAKETGALSFAADVTREPDMKNLTNFTVKQFGALDIWINNAGIALPNNRTIEQTDSAKGHRVFEVNFWGTFYGSRVALAIMKRQGRGAIVNIVSMSALVGRPLSSLYSASKWAARGFTEALRLAAKPSGISVVAIHPGGIKTAIFGKFKPVGYAGWMEPAFVAGQVVKNLKRSKPRSELIIDEKK